MVAQVEIDLSYKEGSQAVHWSCDGSPEFRLEDYEKSAPPSPLPSGRRTGIFGIGAHPPAGKDLRLSAGANQIGSRGD